MGGGPDQAPEHLLITLPFPEPTPIVERIKKEHPYVKITYYNTTTNKDFSMMHESIPVEAWHDATLLVTLSALPPQPEDCPNLKFIHFFSAGTNHIATHPIYTHSTIPLTTSSGIHGPTISEWVLMTYLVSSHAYHTLHNMQLAHQWGTTTDQVSRLRNVHDGVGQRLGVLGYGSIGRQVARVAQAMGMEVLAYTASPRETAESKRDHGFIVPGTGDPEGEIPSGWYSGLEKEKLHDFLAQDLDWLVVSVPLTNDTKHFLGKEEFEILAGRNAFVSNISRGQILVQEELVDALKAYAEDKKVADDASEAPVVEGEEGTVVDRGVQKKRRGLRGAALDVADPEPLPADSDLWDAPNCIVTPHISALASAYTDRAFQVFEVNLTRREKGEKLINVVDRKKGY